MSTHEELGAMIREARLKKSMSLGQLASAIGRSSSSVRRWERGEVTPAVSVVPKLAAILEIDPSEFEAAISQPSNGGTKEKSPTLEQPVVGGDGSAVQAPDQSPPPRSESESGLLADVWRTIASGGRGWMGWVRGLLTAAVLIAMLFAVIWAFGEFLSAVEAVLDSFEVGSSGPQAP